MRSPRIILSRKGFDASYGGYPSIILSDVNKSISFPIPANDKDQFSTIFYQQRSYLDIYTDLGFIPKVNGSKQLGAHLDPDLRFESKPRKKGWRPSLGQANAALSHLDNFEIDHGDIFIFFGWFKFASKDNGKYSYMTSPPNQYIDFKNDLHVCYGYLEVDQVFDVRFDKLPEWLMDHPHARYRDKPNKIYVAKEQFSYNLELPGAGPLPFSRDAILTAPGMSRSKWKIPKSIFDKSEITYHPNPWKKGYFQSAYIGQEFVIKDVTESILHYFLNIISPQLFYKKAG